jgi:hypothetical protein
VVRRDLRAKRAKMMNETDGTNVPRVAWNTGPVCEDANTVLTHTLEDFYEHYMTMDTIDRRKSLLMEDLKKCVGVTKSESLVVRTRQGVRKMMTAELKQYVAPNKIDFMNDEPVEESLLDLMLEAKKTSRLRLVEIKKFT